MNNYVRFRIVFSQNLHCLYSISGALAVKIWVDLLEGLRSGVCFKLRGSGYPKNFQRPLAAKLCDRHPKSFFDVQELTRGPLSP